MTLSERITQLEAALAEARAMIVKHEGGREIVPAALYEVERKVAADLSWLRELRARRIAMGREPDDERNAPRDMCCCDGVAEGWMSSCQLHPVGGDGEPACVQGPPLRCEVFRLDSARGLLSETVEMAPRECPRCGRPAHFAYSDRGTAAARAPICWGEREQSCPGWGQYEKELNDGPDVGPRLRCGAFRLRDCGGVSKCDPLCEPAEAGFPF